MIEKMIFKDRAIARHYADRMILAGAITNNKARALVERISPEEWTVTVTWARTPSHIKKMRALNKHTIIDPLAVIIIDYL